MHYNISPQLQERTAKKRRIQTFCFLLLIAFLFATIIYVHNLLISVLISYIVYNLLAPLVDFLERKGVTRSVATAIPFIFTTLVFAIIIQLLVPILADQMLSLNNNFPNLMKRTTDVMQHWQGRVNNSFLHVLKIDWANKVEPYVINGAQSIVSHLTDYFTSFLAVCFLSTFIGYFMLLQGRTWNRQLIELVPNNIFEMVLNLYHQISTQMGQFIRARILESILVSAMIWIGLKIIGFPYALLLATAAGVLNLIPYVGPIIGALPAFLIAMVEYENPNIHLSIFIVYFFAQVVDTVLLVPFFVAKIVNLHPLTVILAVIMGGQMMGILGMIISIPVASAFKLTIQAIYKHLVDYRTD